MEDRDRSHRSDGHKRTILRAQIEILREVFEEWLRAHDLDYDYWIYTGEEWGARGEIVLSGAELVIAFENQLVDILNWTGPWQIQEELQDLANGFGYYFEIGHHWNIGFYHLDGWPALPPLTGDYSGLLKDRRWAAKRNRIIRRCGGHCEDCGDVAGSLEVHHCYYRFGRYPWQYPDSALLALCKKCHGIRAKVELDWRGFMPRLKISELRDLKDAISKGLYWFDRQHLFSFLTMLNPHDGGQHEKFERLLKTRADPDERRRVGGTGR